MSRAKRSRTALLYSARFRRRMVARPGFGCAAALRPSADITQFVKVFSKAASGRGIPAGGISPVRTLRSTRSSNSALDATLEKSRPSSTTPAVFRLSLWQATQYLFTTERGANAFLDFEEEVIDWGIEQTRQLHQVPRQMLPQALDALCTSASRNFIGFYAAAP